jgi:ParB family chromosome partitioning protein
MNTQSKIQNTIFWIEVEKIVPNPYQPRREFDEDRLKELSDSIRQYGILQPLVVSRKEEMLENGSISVRYELIAGERRLRASKMAGLTQVPVVVRVGDDNREMLELAIIENLQREDLNAVDRAKSFQRLADEFKLTWTDVGKKLGKSREYVSNTVRILMLPQDILDALSKGHITEGHTRPLLMLIERPEEQMTLFKEMLIRKMTVREAEKIARTIAFEKIRKRSLFMTPEVVDTEEKLAEALGTRVQIEPREKGGKILIEYFSHDEFLALSILLKHAGKEKSHKGMFDTIREQDVENLKANATEYMPRKDIEPFEQKSSLAPLQALAGAFGSTTAAPMSTPVVSEMAETATSSITETMAEALPEVYRESDHNFELTTAVKENLLLTEEEAFSTNPEVVAQIALEETASEGELDDRSTVEVKKDEQEEDLYNIKDFTL